MELNTSQPQHSQIMTKPSRNPILYIVVGAVIIAFTALGLLIWQKNQEISSIIGQLADTEERLSNSLNAKDKSPEQESMSALSEDEQSERVVYDASAYYCSVSDFGCDKVTVDVAKLKAVTLTTNGYAIVNATNGSNVKLTLWMIYSVGGRQWVVFYEGQATPPADVIKRFAVPADLSGTN